MFDYSRATEAQKQVLDSKDKNVLVSAAAGSGKTTVMIEKIVRLILDSKISIQNFLVLTFTKASAEDMKNKLINRLSFEKQTPFILEEIDNISVSDVSNLHSFCARLLKSYFYAIGLDPTFVVIDEVEQQKLKTKALDRLFDSEASNGNLEFYEISDIFSNNRKDGKLREQILKIYEFSKSIVDFEAWQENNFERVYDLDLDKNKCAEIIKNYAKNIVNILQGEINDLKNEINQNLDNDDKKKLIEYIDSIDTKLLELNYRQKFDVFAESVKNIGKFKTIPKVEEESKYYQEKCLQLKAVVKSRIDTITNALFTESDDTIETIKNSISTIKKFVRTIYELSKKFDNIYSALKREQGVLDFNDLEMFALKVLEDSEVLAEVKKKYKYIFVDEYQDINSVQEKIITLISSENNRFMVGDIKQSIYGFRLCDPEIFLDKYNTYKWQTDKNESISLNKNFRSHKDILEFVNIIFDNTMTKSFGGVDYKQDARLDPGKIVDRGTHARATLMYIDTSDIETKKDNNNSNLPIYSVKNHEYTESVEAKKAYLEGMIIANKISELLSNSSYTIVDKETKKERRIMYKDIVLLVHSRNQYLNDLLDVLDSLGIPISSDITADVFEDEDILALKNMLLVLSNSCVDKPLFSLMYSNLFNFSPNDLAQIKENGEYKYFYQNVFNIKNDNSELYYKVISFIETINRYRKFAGFMMIKDLCYKIIDEFHIEQYMMASSNRSERLAKLHKFISSLGYMTLNEFLLNNDLNNLSCECKTNSNSVRVMTIHKSKGLEFPVVFLIGVGNKFNLKSVYGDLSVSKELGICMNYFNIENKYKNTSLPRAASKIIENKKFFEEEQRLLYVALTRAIDYLFVSGCAKFDSLEEKFSPTPMSFIEWFAPLILSKDYANSNVFDIEHYDVSGIEKWSKEDKNNNVLIGEFEPNIISALKNNIGYEYLYEAETNTPRKTSVTDIVKSSTINDEKTYKYSNIESSAERGTVYHKVFEYLSLLETKEEEIYKVLNNLIKSRALTEEDIKLIDIKQILECINAPEFRNVINNASWIKKETEFYMLVGEGDRKDRVEVQGIIDLLVEVDGEIILYDYKTGYLNQELSIKKYAKQLEQYKLAAERIFGKKISKSRIIAVDMGKIFSI